MKTSSGPKRLSQNAVRSSLWEGLFYETEQRRGQNALFQMLCFTNETQKLTRISIVLRTLTDWHLIDRSVTTQSSAWIINRRRWISRANAGTERIQSSFFDD